MKWMMAGVLLALLLLVPGAAADIANDNTEFTQDRYLRVAYGDIPRTEAHEPDGQWNFVEYRRFTHAADGSWSPGVFEVQPGAQLMGADCTCGSAGISVGHPILGDRVGVVAVDYNHSAPPGDYIMSLSYSGGSSPFMVNPSGDGDSWSVILYVRPGTVVSSSASPEVAGMPSTAENPGYEIWQFSGTETQRPWIAVGAAATQVSAPASSTNPWLYAAAGLIVGMAFWAFLVSRGAVQRRSRKQVAATAAHVEAAQAEPLPVLEGRKRALMAALKEIELARQGNDLDVPTYDTLKAELKKEAVTVMRAIDEAKGQKA